MGGSRMAGRRVLVVGGSKGTGRATAQLIVEEGGRVAFTGRHADSVNATAAEIGAEGIVADMREEAQSVKAVAQAAERLGGIDGLVNCIGNSSYEKLGNTTLDGWNEMLRVNLTTQFLSCREALPHLRAAGKASIVNIAAVAGMTPGMTGLAYSTAKSAIIQFTKHMAAELVSENIRANVVSPGAIRSQRMLNGFIAARTKEQVDHFLSRYGMKRMAEEKEIAALIVFLLSHDASYITGSNYVADGGRVYH